MTGTQWLCTPECWQKGSHTEGCGPIPDDRDKRIAELEAQHRWLETRHRLQGEVLTNVKAERDRLKETIAWIWDHSNDPGVVERARQVLNKADTQEADNA